MSEFDEDKHGRDAKGRFSTGGSALSMWADKRAPRLAGFLYDKVDKQGGASYRPGGKPSEREPKTGFMVAVPIEKGLNHVIDIRAMANRIPHPTRSELKKEVVGHFTEWLQKALPALKDMPGHFLGPWLQKDDAGNPIALHLDGSQQIADRDKAVQAGKDRNQIEVWDVVKGEGISTGGTGK
jgi:hypothetical protein